MAKNYICTNCSRPTLSLYKVYSTPGSIQLTTCKYCGEDVDPYIEREWILVIIDCVLHRPKAFRHLLYNRDTFGDMKPECTTSDNEIKTKNNNSSKGYVSAVVLDQSNYLQCWGTLVRFTTVASILKAFIWYFIADTDTGAIANKSDSTQALSENGALNASFAVIFGLFLGEIIFVSTTALFATLIVQTFAKTESNGDEIVSTILTESATKINKKYFVKRIYAASTLPSFFHIVTIFVLVWEKSLTVCSLGALFVLSLQRLGIATVVDGSIIQKSQKSKARKNSNLIAIGCLIQSLPFLFGMIFRTIIIYLVNSCFEKSMFMDSTRCTVLLLSGIFVGKEVCVV